MRLSVILPAAFLAASLGACASTNVCETGYKQCVADCPAQNGPDRNSCVQTCKYSRDRCQDTILSRAAPSSGEAVAIAMIDAAQTGKATESSLCTR